jgi:hypothetical protein
MYLGAMACKEKRALGRTLGSIRVQRQKKEQVNKGPESLEDTVKNTSIAYQFIFHIQLL